MPDMQTEVKKIISSWTLPEEAPKASRESDKSFSERVYDYIKSTPKCSMKQIRQAFNIANKDDASVASTLKTLYDRKLIGRVAIDNPEFKGYGRRVIFVYWAVANTYETQIKGLYSKKKKVVKIIAKKDGVVDEAINRIKQAPEAKPASKGKFDAEAFVNSLNIYEARHVYQLLDIVFGNQGSK